MYVFCAVGVFSLSGTQMLFAGSNFLNAGRNFLLAVGNFLFAGLNCGSAVKNFYLSGGKSENDNGSFALSGRNSLFAVANFLNDVVGLRLLYFLKLNLLTCLNCGLVAPKTDLTYFFTSPAMSTSPFVVP